MSTCHSAPGQVNHNSSLTFSIYIYISFVRNLFVLKLEKEEKTQSLWGGGVFRRVPSLQSASTRKKKKVSGVCLVTHYVRVHTSTQRCSSCSLWSLLHPDLFPWVFWRRREEQWREGGRGGGVISSVSGVVSWRHPNPPHPILLQLRFPSPLDGAPEWGEADQKVWFVL